MANLILPCEWQTARSPASIATTDRFAAAGVGAFVELAGDEASPMKREQKITLGRGPASRIELSSSSGFDDRREILRDDRVQSLHSKGWLAQALRHVHLI